MLTAAGLPIDQPKGARSAGDDGPRHRRTTRRLSGYARTARAGPRRGERTDAFIQRQNIAHYRSLLESGSLDETQYRAIEKLLAEKARRATPMRLARDSKNLSPVLGKDHAPMIKPEADRNLAD
jgi:hypothetical protein